jgi:hypothetical protein
MAQMDLGSQETGVNIELVPVDASETKVGLWRPSGGVKLLVDADPKPCLVIPDEDPEKVLD